MFLGVLAVMAVLEVMLPRRGRSQGRATRWTGNLGVVVIANVLARLLLPVTVVGAALLAEARGIGLLRMLDVPYWAAVVISVILLDLVVYWQHVIFHHVPMLWRLHRMHHADLDFDATTGIRFHPLEILVSIVVKAGVVVIVGVPAVGVVIFEVLLNASAMFNHSNTKLPLGLDRVLRRVLVTPDMHRVHHSVIPEETHSNFGFCLPWWDWMFSTYQDQPAAGHERMTIGLPILRDPEELRLDHLLTQPWRES